MERVGGSVQLRLVFQFPVRPWGRTAARKASPLVSQTLTKPADSEYVDHIRGIV